MMIVIVRMQMMVRVMNLVDNHSTRHEEHALGHGVVEQVEQGSAKGDDHDAVVDVIVGILGPVGEVFVSLKGVCQVESSTQSGEDIGEL